MWGSERVQDDWPAFVPLYAAHHPPSVYTWRKAGRKVRRGKETAHHQSQFRGSGWYLSNNMLPDSRFEYGTQVFYF